MTTYEQLTEDACRDGIEVIDYDFISDNIKGLYCDNIIAINHNIRTDAERVGVLAEELGHYHTTSGNILDMSDVQNRKQERQARIWAYNNRIGLYGLITAYENRCSNLYEIAEFLEVTEDFLEEAINCYRQKYGVCKNVDNYTIYFIPQLAVYKRM